MKNILNLCIAALLLAACSSNEKLDRETALKLIEDSKTYPKVVGYNIFVSDPAYAKRVLDAGLEESGFVIVQRTRKLGEIGQPIISFTAKADPYLLPQSNQDKSDGIRRVKIADEVLEEVTGVQMLNGNKNAVVEISTSLEKITPFSKLSKQKLDKMKPQPIMFTLYDDGWRVQKK
ncbi:MAG: hypothetical protein WBJ10_14400 [Daejeonella sp.]|uniref:hypothetical protein n=1 Tax=Daejeonella sp. TaxID=2805397 RepID=UPI003C7890F5